MSRAVWKFPIEITDRQVLQMPHGAQIHYVAVQHEKICLWASVDTNVDLEERVIIVAGTGHAISDTDLRYIGTVQFYREDLVFHIFENVGYAE